MISMISEEGRTKVGIYEYVIDTATELSQVPTDVQVGSIVYCIENSKKYMLNSSGSYVEVNFKKGGSGGEAKLGTKDIDENGSYKASDFDLDGWSQVNVNVSGGDEALTKLIDRTITSLVIPDDVKRIGVSAFASCEELEAVVLHENVRSIANYAFQNCTKLMSITLKATEPTRLLGTGSLAGVPNDCNIYVPAESVDAYKTANRWNARAGYIQAIS